MRSQAHGSHGDMLFLSYKTQSADPSSHPTTQPSSSTSHPSQPDPSHPHTHTDPPLPNTIPLKDLSKVDEMAVDKLLRSQTGIIERKRDPVLCRHGEKAMCEYCMPLEVSCPFLVCGPQLMSSLMIPSFKRRTRSSISHTMPTCANSSPHDQHQPLLRPRRKYRPSIHYPCPSSRLVRLARMLLSLVESALRVNRAL